MEFSGSVKLQTVFNFDLFHLEHFVARDQSHLSEQKKNGQKIDFHHSDSICLRDSLCLRE